MGSEFEEKAPSREYGVVSRKVMRDASLPCEAKAIYSYICSFAGDGSTSFPGVDTMIEELGMSRGRFYKYRGLLVDAGYVSVEKGRREGSKYEHNIYRIMDSDQPGADQCRIVVAESGQSQNLTAENAKSSQVDGQSRFETVENPTANNGWMVGDSYEGMEREDLPAEEDLHEDKVPSEEATAALKSLISASLNRNRTTRSSDRDAMASRIDALAAAGYAPTEVCEAWELEQARCRRQGLDRRFYPQLFRFLAEGADAAVRAMRREKAASCQTMTVEQAFAAAKYRHASDPEVARLDGQLAELAEEYRAASKQQKPALQVRRAKVAEERNAIIWKHVAEEMPGIEVPERFRA